MRVSLRLDLAQYRELEAFAKFGSDLDKADAAAVTRGQSMMELLKQDQYDPMVVEMQVVVLFLGVRGFIDDIPIGQIRRFEGEFVKFMNSEGKNILDSIRTKKEITPETSDALTKLIEEFKTTFVVK